MKMIKYLKGKIVQLKTPKKEVYNGISNKINNTGEMICIYANEIYTAGDANGFYIFRFNITEKQEEFVIPLLNHLSACNLYFHKYDKDYNRYLYMYGTAKNIAKLIDKYTYNIYSQSDIITKTEVNTFLLYPSIYRSVYGNLDKFDTSLPSSHIIHNNRRVKISLDESIATQEDMEWVEKKIDELLYINDTNSFVVFLNEDEKVKKYKEGYNILEEDYDENSFDPSIDEII